MPMARKRIESLPHAALDDVLQVHDAERRVRSATTSGVPPARAIRSTMVCSSAGERAAVGVHVGGNRVGGALADLAAVEIDAGHPRLRRERHEAASLCEQLASANAVLLLGEHDDRSSLGRFVGQRRQLRGVGQLALGDAGQRHELGRLAVAQRDRAGLVEKQRVDVAGRFDRAPGHRQHVVLHQAVHAGDADGGDQRADGRRNQAHEQRDEHRNRNLRAGVVRKRLQRHDDEQEDERQDRQQNVQRDLVRRLLPFGALDERDHAVQERVPGIRGHAHLDPVRNDTRAAGDGRAVAT